MTAEPPLYPGALQAKYTFVLLAVAETAVGASGTVAGVTGLDDDDDGPVPTAFVAVTVKV